MAQSPAAADYLAAVVSFCLRRAPSFARSRHPWSESLALSQLLRGSSEFLGLVLVDLRCLAETFACFDDSEFVQERYLRLVWQHH